MIETELFWLQNGILFYAAMTSKVAMWSSVAPLGLVVTEMRRSAIFTNKILEKYCICEKKVVILHANFY
ncbi:MAG: hypothetical protein ACI4UO_01570, partial [Paludibacteraceae bacterium]